MLILKNRFSYILILIFFISLIIRLLFSFILPLDGGDEAYQLLVSNKPLTQMLTATISTYAPVWSLILHFLEKISQNYIHIRFITSIIGALTVICFGYLGKILFNNKIGLYAALVTMVSPTLIFYSANSRMYAFSIFICVLTYILLINFLIRNSSIVSSAMLILMVMGNYTHFLFPLVTFSFGIILFLKHYEQFKRFLFIFFISIFLSLPLYVAFLQAEQVPIQAHPGISLVKIMIIPINFNFPINLIFMTDLYPQYKINTANTALLLFAIFSLIIAYFGIIKLTGFKAFILKWMLVLPHIVLVLFSLLVFSVLGFRTLLIFTIPFYIILARSLALFGKVIFIYIFFAFVVMFSTLLFFKITDIYPTERFLMNNFKDGDIIIHSEITTFWYYKYLYPNIPGFAVNESLYLNKYIQNLLNFTPINLSAQNNQTIWLIEIPSTIHKLKREEFKKLLSKKYKQVLQKHFNDAILYKYTAYGI